MLISQSLSPVAQKNGARIAFRYLKYSITYKDFWETSNRYSYYLQKEFGHGLRVGLWMSNCPHVAYSFIALSNTKSCTIPLNPWAAPDENLQKIKRTGVTHILCSSDHTKSLQEFLFQNGLSSMVVLDIETKRAGEYDPSFTPPANHPPQEGDEILILFTPGTTGQYKPCVFDHKSICQALSSIRSAYKASPSDVFYTQHHYSTAFNWIHYLLMPLSAAATVFISDERDSKTVIKNLVEHKVTRMAPNLAGFEDLLKTSEAEKLPIPLLKNFVFTGAPLSKEIWTLLKRTKIEPIYNYGMTEYLGTIAMNTAENSADFYKPNQCGVPLSGTKVRVVDDNSDEIDKKKPQKGQLLVSGPMVMKKYLDLPDEQKNTVRGSWLFTGDFVEINSKGQILFEDRKADIVIVEGGKKVFPREVEPIVMQIKTVQECAYIGVKDQLKKPVPLLIVVRKLHAQLTDAEIYEVLAKKVTKDKHPVSIIFVDALPRTISGGINRARLRMLYTGV